MDAWYFQSVRRHVQEGQASRHEVLYVLDSLWTEIEPLRAQLQQARRAATLPPDDPDFQAVLQGLQALAERLYPSAEPVSLPMPLLGAALSAAQRRVAEDRVWAWRNPTDGSRRLTLRAIAERLGCKTTRVASLEANAARRHRWDRAPEVQADTDPA